MYFSGKGACWATFDGTAKDHYQATSEKTEVALLRDMSFSYDLDFGDSIGGAGVIFNLSGCEDSSDIVSGYMLSFNFINPPDSCGISNIFYYTRRTGSIWYFKYNKGMIKGKPYLNRTPLGYSDCTHITNLTIPQKGRIILKKIEDGYEIYYQANQYSTMELKYTINNVSSKMDYNFNSFGFFSSHFQHGCQGIGRFELTDIAINADFMPMGN